MILIILAFLLFLSVWIRFYLKNKTVKPKTSDLRRQQYVKQLNLLDRWEAEGYEGITKEKIQLQQNQLYAYINQLMEPSNTLDDVLSQSIDTFIQEVQQYEQNKKQRIQTLEKQEKFYADGLEKSRSFFERVKIFPVSFVYTANDLEKKLLDLRVLKHADPLQTISEEELKKFEDLFLQMDELDVIYTDLTLFLANFQETEAKKKVPTKTARVFKEQQEKIYSAIYANQFNIAANWLEKSKDALQTIKKQEEA